MLNTERGRAGLVCSHKTAGEEHVLKRGIENPMAFHVVNQCLVSGLYLCSALDP